MKINVKKEIKKSSTFSKHPLNKNTKGKKHLLFIFTISLPLLIISTSFFTNYKNNKILQKENSHNKSVNHIIKNIANMYTNIIYNYCKQQGTNSNNLQNLKKTSINLLTQQLNTKNFIINKFVKIQEQAKTNSNIINIFFNTRSVFSHNIYKIITHKIQGTIPFKTIMKYTENLPPQSQKILQQGQNGYFNANLHLILTKQITKQQIVCNNIQKLQVQNIVYPINQVILKGKKPQIRNIVINNKQITYYRSLKVWATSYDSSCKGCNNITATGRKLTYGIIAVDPNVIPLHTCMYIPGYGYGQAEDVGGAVKGNHIDLAFDNIKHGWWSARYVTIYIVDCKNAKLPWNK